MQKFTHMWWVLTVEKCRKSMEKIKSLSSSGFKKEINAIQTRYLKRKQEFFTIKNVTTEKAVHGT